MIVDLLVIYIEVYDKRKFYSYNPTCFYSLLMMILKLSVEESHQKSKFALWTERHESGTTDGFMTFGSKAVLRIFVSWLFQIYDSFPMFDK